MVGQGPPYGFLSVTGSRGVDPPLEGVHVTVKHDRPASAGGDGDHDAGAGRGRVAVEIDEDASREDVIGSAPAESDLAAGDAGPNLEAPVVDAGGGVDGVEIGGVVPGVVPPIRVGEDDGQVVVGVGRQLLEVVSGRRRDWRRGAGRGCCRRRRGPPNRR